MKPIRNTENTIYSIDILDRIEEIETGDHTDGVLEELESLKSIVEAVGNYGNFKSGEFLISEYHFVAYCQEVCEDVGDIPNDLPWYVADNINWDGVAQDMGVDYADVDFDGVDYYLLAR